MEDFDRRFFQKLIPPDSTALDLGSGWGEFINNNRAAKKYGMDLNPEGRQRLAADVEFLEQDCSREWPVAEGSLDCVFTSDFFEHLPDKGALRATLTWSASQWSKLRGFLSLSVILWRVPRAEGPRQGYAFGLPAHA